MPERMPILLMLFFVCYVTGCWHIASTNPLWMYEVLAVWTARLPSSQQVWSALLHGSEASPPGYHLLLHLLQRAAGDRYAVYRAPSIVASCVTGLCLFSLLRRYLGSAAAAYGTVFGLLGVVAWFAVEARPYALVTTCFAGAVLLWDSLDWHHRGWGRISLMALLLALGISLHFYATLFVPCVGAMELVWSYLNRRFRVPVWVGLFLAGATTFLWLPFILAQSRMIVDETKSPGFYGRPTLGKLTHAYSDLIIYDKKQALLLAFTVVIVGALLVSGRRRIQNAERPPMALPFGATSKLYVIAFCSVMFPLLVFAFSAVVTKTFNMRYCLVAALGFAVLIAYLARSVPVMKPTVPAILLAACPLAFLSELSIAESLPDQVAVVEQAPGPYPIVVGEGRMYFELEEALPPQLKSRLVYVEAPAGVRMPDPTNEHHLERWSRIKPGLTVVGAQPFLTQHPRFYLFHTGQSTDVITPWLTQRRDVRELIAQKGDAALYEVEVPGSVGLTQKQGD